MKVIDLLNKIANGEEVPKEIRLGDEPDIFYYQDNINSYKTYYNEYLMCDYLCNTSNLNDEVEIIKGDKKIENLQYSKLVVCPDLESLLEYVNENREIFREKINEIIDKINEEK